MRIVVVRFETAHTDSDSAYRSVVRKIKDAGYDVVDCKIDYDGITVETDATVLINAREPDLEDQT